MSSLFAPNRIAVYFTIAAGLASAIAPALADMDTTSVAGVIAGVVAIVTATTTFLFGWQKHEARQAALPADDPVFPVVEDEAQSTTVAPA